MMNYKHLNSDQKKQLLKLVNNVGAVEVIRVIGQLVAVQHPCIDKGNDYRSNLNAIASKLNDDNDGLISSNEQHNKH